MLLSILSFCFALSVLFWVWLFFLLLWKTGGCTHVAVSESCCCFLGSSSLPSLLCQRSDSSRKGGCVILKLSLYTRSPPLYTALPLVARIAHVHQTLLSNCARRDRSAHVPPFRSVRSFFSPLARIFPRPPSPWADCDSRSAPARKLVGARGPPPGIIRARPIRRAF